MPRQRTNTRARLAQAALKISYRHGFDHAALTDIAKEARVPLGNVYYYFKTKDEIGDAIIELRILRLRRLLEELDQLRSPRERLCGFVELKIKNREQLARLGCPVGTLCSELHKRGGPVAWNATKLLERALSWMETQFKALGKGPDSRGLAIHLLSATQGVSLLAHVFHEPEIITAEAKRLKDWIHAL
jgi:TetR/AcrR family transcriptional regulator, transcriptional repressor for nem operon